MKFLRLSSPIFVILCIALLFPGTSFAVWRLNKSKALPSSRFMTVRTTAYTHSESDHIVYGRKNALDSRLLSTRKYTSAAADWSRFPVGTTFKIKGLNRTFVIDDYGSALVGTDTIDLYQTTRKGMNKWGARHVQIEILKWGDFEKSRQVLRERKGYSHIRKMLAGINSKNRRSSPFLNTSPPSLPPEPEAVSPAPIGNDGGTRQFRQVEYASLTRRVPATRLIATPVNLAPMQAGDRYAATDQQCASYPDQQANTERRNPLAAIGRKLFGRERAVSSRTRQFRPMKRKVSISVAEPSAAEEIAATPVVPSSTTQSIMRKPRSFRALEP